MLLDKYRAIQLSEGEEYSLEDAKNVLLYIISINNDYIPAYIELGFFYEVIDNDSKKSIEEFNIAIKKSKMQLIDSYYGKVYTLFYMNKYKHALKIAKFFEYKDSRFKKIIIEIQDILSTEMY